jgi:hypothetical protein
LYFANKNKEIIDEIQELHKEARKKDVKISVQLVKGHADSIGNIKADILADIGREASLTDLIVIKDYEYSEYFDSPKVESLILDNFTKIIDNRDKVAKINKAQVEEIAKKKMPDLNAASLESAMSMVAGTARSMGVVITE